MLRSILNTLLRKSAAVGQNDERRVEFLTCADADGFSWDEVRRIAAYKVDLAAADLVYLEFGLHDLKTYVTHEDLPGFDAFRRALAREFPCIDTDWYRKVMRPAFATNYTILYESNGGRPQATPGACPAWLI